MPSLRMHVTSATWFGFYAEVDFSRDRFSVVLPRPSASVTVAEREMLAAQNERWEGLSVEVFYRKLITDQYSNSVYADFVQEQTGQPEAPCGPSKCPSHP